MLGAAVAALGLCADGIGEGLYAVRHGYRGRAATLGFAVAAVLAARCSARRWRSSRARASWSGSDTVTAFTNPFHGIVAGELVKLLH
ncbi:hypothetical protein [Actinomadura chibensis]|uniref:Uncharacterized protein n=1 Tax=Actinomadura chibensis TaxID=392828 RepID=A0A5D0NVT5_9ACTN|nr:hypothetical protein [Actinomadura chibensis]TYB48527.1 hypothetical protein FXF69_04895 [Actinomadura chibensis]